MFTFRYVLAASLADCTNLHIVDKQSYDTTLHDLSKDVHFKKRGNDDMEGNCCNFVIRTNSWISPGASLVPFWLERA